MEKKKSYPKVRFSSTIVQEAVNRYLSIIGGKENISDNKFMVRTGNEQWYLDSFEEFLSEYNKSEVSCLDLRSYAKIFNFEMWVYPGTNTEIDVHGKNRGEIESIFQIFENNVERSRIIVRKDPVKIFIGHGNDDQWRLLKDHLHDLQKFEVIAYEIGPRAGLSVKEVLEEMLNKSSIAFLILTGEDVTNYGELYARQNVVHELGLFQGKLGFKKPIALLEEGVTEFSNIYGVNQIRFSQGNIRETFGDVVATIKREFD